jgi:two-component system chemotaxis sensor kinase CheA
MSQTGTTGGAAGADTFDLSQFHSVFFEEAGENLETMERLLLDIDLESADDEELNAIFRCAHSVKGGAATFGFADVAELTHQMESLLDKLRRHELAPSASMVDVLLAAGDALKALLARHKGETSDELDTRTLVADIAALAAGGAPAAAAAPAPAAPAPAPAAAEPASAPAAAPTTPAGERLLEITVGPLPKPEQADGLIELFKEVVDLGALEPLDAGMPADGMRRFKVTTKSSDADLLDLISFHVDREHVRIAPLGPGYGFHKNAPGAPKEAAPAPVDDSFGFFDDAPGAPGSDDAAPPPPSSSSSPAVEAATATAAPVSKAKAKPVAATSDTTLRVSVEKVDQLINLVGELVITQSMLAQTSARIDPALYQQMMAGLTDLERNTRDLQEAVMSIRMIPMSVVFNRFPRMLRELAAKLGKKVEFVTVGETTELDKGMVEKITDPLTHLVRNSCDHGVELPADRVAKGKAETGTITLSASHQGGNIVIEVRDDGRGLSREKLLKKARERGIDAPDSMTDSEVWNLIFAPGFSTAEVVTDVSGRGVGMDVVKKNITALGGTVEIESAEGFGMSVKVRLPLTLAIMEAMSIGVGGECYILPLSSVVESFQPEGERVKTVGGTDRVVRVRDEYLPVIELQEMFAVPARDDAPGEPVMVIIESEGVRVAMVVDELLGQQQVVVKNLETNYRRVEHVAGATIMGDGRVALILDVGSLVKRSRH